MTLSGAYDSWDHPRAVHGQRRGSVRSFVKESVATDALTAAGGLGCYLASLSGSYDSWDHPGALHGRRRGSVRSFVKEFVATDALTAGLVLVILLLPV